MEPAATASRSWDPPAVQWVVKVSKHCNLRCTYCYEFPFLGDPKRMEYDELQGMFRNIADYYQDAPKRMDFVWHGGEPLVQKPDFYRRVEELEHEAFDSRNIPFTNSVQTNLTLLNDGNLDLLKTFFTHIGVSIDLFGDQRVNVAGKIVQETVLRNMQTLKDEDIRFGCITVLSRATVPYVEHIYRFFEEIETSFRLLPIYRTGYEGQQNWLALSAEEILQGMKTAIDLWFASDSNIQVRPIQDYITHAVWHLDKARPVNRRYEKHISEVVYIVDTDGTLFSNADAYDLSLCHGNLFKESLRDLKCSEGYWRALEAAQLRMAETCRTCKYHGACSGYFMGEATPEQRWYDDLHRLQCAVVQPAQAYVEQILVEAGIADSEKGLLDDKIWGKLTAQKSSASFEG